MAWMTYWDADYERVHVLPCTPEGIILSPHIADDACPCHPVKTAEGLVLIHDQVH